MDVVFWILISVALWILISAVLAAIAWWFEKGDA